VTGNQILHQTLIEVRDSILLEKLEECDLETIPFSLVPSQSNAGVVFSPVRRGLG
jgi:hypothetical protein